MGLKTNQVLEDDDGQKYVIDKPLFTPAERERRMGLVYLAHRTEEPDVQCAVKIPNVQPDMDDFGYEHLIDLFRREIFFQGRLGVPGSPFAEFYGEFPDITVSENLMHSFRVPGFAMEYLPGRSLDQKNPPPPYEVCEILKKVLSALAVAHDQKILLRDLKLEHLIVDGEVVVENEQIVTRDLVVKVLDLGLAENQGFVEHGGCSLVGTAQYIPPELATRPQNPSLYASPRRDLYAVGVIAHQLLTGRWPTEGAYREKVLLLKTVQDPKPVGAFQERSNGYHPIPPELRDFTMKLLARDPEERYGDAIEALAALCKIDQTKFIASQVALDVNAVIENLP